MIRSHRSALFLSFLGLLAMLLTGCGEATCDVDYALTVDLAGELGDSGSDIATRGPGSNTASNSTCAGISNGTATADVGVLREGNTLTLTIGTTPLSFALTGDTISQSDFNVDNSACEQTFSNVQGAIDYTTGRVAVSYTITYGDKMNCGAF